MGTKNSKKRNAGDFIHQMMGILSTLKNPWL